MSGLIIRVRNMGRLQSKVKKLPTDIQDGVVEGLRGIAPLMEAEIQEDIRTGPRSGNIVTRYNPERIHQASAPGEVPANDRGTLADSIEVEVDPIQFNLTIAALADHAPDLEYGTRWMLPRPFLRPALTRWRDRIINAIHKAIKGRL